MNPRTAASCVLVLLALPFTSVACCALGPYSDMGCAEWIANTYTNASFDDVYQIAFHQVDRDYDMSSDSDPNEGRIETHWDHGSVAQATRMMQRERVIIELDAKTDGIELKLRVQRQVRERTGLLTPDDQSEDDWSYTADDFERARVVFGRIQAMLDHSGPSDDFYQRPVDPTR